MGAGQLPATDIDGSSGQPVNVAEEKLRRMLEAASLPGGRWQEQRSLPRPLNTTTPDVTYDDPDDEERKILIYLDGLSEHIHGNPETRQRDREIRGELRSQDHDVIEVTAVELDDPIAMLRHFRRLARLLIGRDGVDRVRDEAEDWFAAREGEAEQTTTEAGPITPDMGTSIIEGPFRRLEEPEDEYKYQTCVPIYSLQAAAGGFSEGHVPEPDGWAALDTGHSLSEGMFVAKVVGRSMEPEIPDGAWCLFRRDPGGSRQGKTVLAQLHDAFDPEDGASFTVKRYERVGDVEGDELGGEIYLKPVNPEFKAIVVREADEVSVIAEVIEVLSGIGAHERTD